MSQPKKMKEEEGSPTMVGLAVPSNKKSRLSVPSPLRPKGMGDGFEGGSGEDEKVKKTKKKPSPSPKRRRMKGLRKSVMGFEGQHVGDGEGQPEGIPLKTCPSFSNPHTSSPSRSSSSTPTSSVSSPGDSSRRNSGRRPRRNRPASHMGFILGFDNDKLKEMGEEGKEGESGGKKKKKKKKEIELQLESIPPGPPCSSPLTDPSRPRSASSPNREGEGDTPRKAKKKKLLSFSGKKTVKGEDEEGRSPHSCSSSSPRTPHSSPQIGISPLSEGGKKEEREKDENKDEEKEKGETEEEDKQDETNEASENQDEQSKEGRDCKGKKLRSRTPFSTSVPSLLISSQDCLPQNESSLPSPLSSSPCRSRSPSPSSSSPSTTPSSPSTFSSPSPLALSSPTPSSFLREGKEKEKKDKGKGSKGKGKGKRITLVHSSGLPTSSSTPNTSTPLSPLSQSSSSAPPSTPSSSRSRSPFRSPFRSQPSSSFSSPSSSPNSLSGSQSPLLPPGLRVEGLGEEGAEERKKKAEMDRKKSIAHLLQVFPEMKNYVNIEVVKQKGEEEDEEREVEREEGAREGEEEEGVKTGFPQSKTFLDLGNWMPDHPTVSTLLTSPSNPSPSSSPSSMPLAPPSPSSSPKKPKKEKKPFLRKRQMISCVFGLSLDRLFERSGIAIPVAVAQCMGYLKEKGKSGGGGLRTEGIFRISAPLNEIERISSLFRTPITFVNLEQEVHSLFISLFVFRSFFEIF